VKDQQIQLVLDSSAVLAYAGGSIHVGETITEVVDEGARFGASVVTLAEASRLVLDEDALGVLLLARHARFEPLAAVPQDWTRIAWWSRTLGSVDRATAVVEALDRDAYVVTAEPEAYQHKGVDELPVIGV
jgi:hypothetical protein